jgi:hypothetical protein
MDRLDKRSVQVEIPEQVLILPEHFTTIPLFSVTVPHPVMVPIVPRADTRSKDWLPPIHILALAKPIASTGDLMTFAQKAWELGEARVVIGVTKVQVTLPLSGWLARFGKMEKEDITRQLQMPGTSYIRFNTNTHMTHILIPVTSRSTILSRPVRNPVDNDISPEVTRITLTR